MEAEEFCQLFERYKNRVYGYVLTITKSAYAAEELTQEIFIKLWLYRDMLHEVENMDGYLFRIARNIALNHLRKAAYDEKLLAKLLQQMIPEFNNIDDKIVVAEYNQLVNEALNKMSQQPRTVYKLSRDEGMNHQQIALHLQLSPNTVKNHMVSALKTIRDQLNKSGLAIVMLSVFLLDSGK